MRQILTTDGVTEQDRLDYWHDVVRTVFWPLRVAMPKASRYRAALTHDVCGALEVSTVTSEQQFVRRTAAEADGGAADRVMLGLQLAGPGVVIQDGRECTLRPGEASLLDPARPYSMGFSQSFSLAVFSLPRALLVSMGVDTRKLTARLLSPQSTVATTALSYLSCVAAISTTSGLTDTTLANGALGIATGLLREAGGSAAADLGGEQTYERACAFIDLNLHRDSLTPTDIAAACHVSLRQLYRVFDARGLGVAEAVRQRRLTLARSLLESLSAEVPVAWVGSRVGFASTEQFTRVFRDAHGLPPAAWRATRWVAPGQHRPDSSKGDPARPAGLLDRNLGAGRSAELAAER